MAAKSKNLINPNAGERFANYFVYFVSFVYLVVLYMIYIFPSICLSIYFPSISHQLINPPPLSLSLSIFH